MKFFASVLLVMFSLFAANVVSAQVVDQGLDNPELEVLYPRDGMPYFGFFVVGTRNIKYTPELATSAGSEFAVGNDKSGGPLLQNEGHLHGWVFKMQGKDMVRNDSGRPSPSSYVKFFGAGGADFYGTYDAGIYVVYADLPKGKYRAFFQAQQNDHTAMRQANAPAFPAIAVVSFVVKKFGW